MTLKSKFTDSAPVKNEDTKPKNEEAKQPLKLNVVEVWYESNNGTRREWRQEYAHESLVLEDKPDMQWIVEDIWSTKDATWTATVEGKTFTEGTFVQTHQIIGPRAGDMKISSPVPFTVRAYLAPIPKARFDDWETPKIR